MHKRQKNQVPSQKRQVAKNELEKMVDEFPNLSVRKAASALQVSTTLIFSILHDDFHLKSYKYHEWHKLEAHDYEKRLEFAQWFISLPIQSKFSLICSDEAYFYLTPPINKQNNRTWGKSPPLEGIEVPSLHVKIWSGAQFSPKKFTGHSFLKNL